MICNPVFTQILYGMTFISLQDEDVKNRENHEQTDIPNVYCKAAYTEKVFFLVFEIFSILKSDY